MGNSSVLTVEHILIDLTIYNLIERNVKARKKIKVSIILLLKLTFVVQLDFENALVEHLHYDGTYQVAVCDKCKHALPKEWIKGHFKDVHQVLVKNSFVFYN